MSTITPDYWAAAATIMPVLAATIVIETREIIRSWDSEYPRSLKAVQFFIAGLPLLVMALAEAQCFRALRGGDVSERWNWAIEWAVSSAMGVLVAAPAILFIANGTLNLYGIFYLAPSKLRRRYAIWRSQRLHSRMQTRVWEGRAETVRAEHELVRFQKAIDKDLDALIKKRDAAQAEESPEVLTVARLDYAINRMSEKRDKAAALLARIRSVTGDWQSVTDELQELSKKLSENLSATARREEEK